MGSKAALLKKLGTFANKAFKTATRKNCGKLIDTYTNRAGEKIEVFERTKRSGFLGMGKKRTITTHFKEGVDSPLRQTVSQKKGGTIFSRTTHSNGSWAQKTHNLKTGQMETTGQLSNGDYLNASVNTKTKDINTVVSNNVIVTHSVTGNANWGESVKVGKPWGNTEIVKNSYPAGTKEIYIDDGYVARGTYIDPNNKVYQATSNTRDMYSGDWIFNWNDTGNTVRQAVAKPNNFNLNKKVIGGAALAVGVGAYALLENEDDEETPITAQKDSTPTQPAKKPEAKNDSTQQTPDKQVEQNDAVPAAPADSVPAAPADSVPTAPARPVAPADSVPAAPADSVPAAPVDSVPTAPARPVAPADSVPAAPADSVPAAPVDSVPTAPARPVAPADSVPAAPADSVPAAPVDSVPTAPARPVAPADSVPAAPADSVPAAPAQPEQPAQQTPPSNNLFGGTINEIQIKEYDVVKDDCLWNIAKRELQKANPGVTISNGQILVQVKEFIRLNPQIKNPDLIYANQKIKTAA